MNAGDTYGRTPLHEVAGRAYRSSLSVDDLLELGARLDATGWEGRTALHYAVDAQNLAAVQTLLSHGADPNASGDDGQSPLEWGLQRLDNIDFPRMVPVAREMLAAGARRTQAAQDYTRGAAAQFEFHRESFAADIVDETAAAMGALCELLDVEPPGPRRVHDGVSPIAATATTWQQQHAELWDFLVPSRGAAKTVQGEVIRVTGRIGDELFRNGGGNWDRGYRAMANALIKHLGSGNALPPAQLAEAKAVASRLLEDMNGATRLMELAVAWVAQNSTPTALPPPRYRR